MVSRILWTLCRNACWYGHSYLTCCSKEEAWNFLCGCCFQFLSFCNTFFWGLFLLHNNHHPGHHASAAGPHTLGICLELSISCFIREPQHELWCLSVLDAQCSWIKMLITFFINLRRWCSALSFNSFVFLYLWGKSRTIRKKLHYWDLGMYFLGEAFECFNDPLDFAYTRKARNDFQNKAFGSWCCVCWRKQRFGVVCIWVRKGIRSKSRVLFVRSSCSQF